MGTGAGSELVDVVDETDRVIGVTTRTVMRRDRLRHRAVFVAVQSSSGRLLAHRRADDKDIWPGRWDVAVGGVVAAGESFDDAAGRELAEELGITEVVLVPIGGGVFDDPDVSLIGRCYLTIHDGPFTFADGEVSEVRWIDVADVGALAGEPDGIVPDSLALVVPLVVATRSATSDCGVCPVVRYETTSEEEER